MDTSIQSIKDEEGIYDRLNDMSRRVDFDELNFQDKDWIKRTLGVLFVTNPISEQEPFSVKNKTEFENLRGRKFEVNRFKISPRDTICGGIYRVHLQSFHQTKPICYNFLGKVNQSPNLIQIKQSYIRRIGDVNLITG